jgi:hypothetical protein
MPAWTIGTGRILDNAVIAQVVQDLLTRVDYMRPRRFLDRTPVRTAALSEIIAVWTASRFAADVIANSQKAVTVSAGKLEAYVTDVPNVKIGTHLNQEDLNRLKDLTDRGAFNAEEQVFDYWYRTVESLVGGVRDRLNVLCCQMELGTVVYDRWGVKINQTYNVPSNLLTTPTNPWTDATNAVPITDLENMRNLAADQYGVDFNRATMRREDLDLMFLTTQFKNLALPFLAVGGLTTAAINPANRRQMQDIAGRVLNMDLETDLTNYRVQGNDAATTTNKVLPLGKVILSDSNNDGDPSVADLANMEVTEAMVAEMTNMDIGLRRGQGPNVGPVAFWTPEASDLNPPGVNCWAVQRATNVTPVGVPTCPIPANACWPTSRPAARSCSPTGRASPAPKTCRPRRCWPRAT